MLHLYAFSGLFLSALLICGIWIPLFSDGFILGGNFVPYKTNPSGGRRTTR